MSVLDIKRLDQVDWDFPRAGTEPGSVHSVHSIPGNFIPQIPAALIQILSKPGDLVLDPFSGSGTTAVEALKLGRNVIASDYISACIITSEAKLYSVTDPINKNIFNKIISDITFEHLCKTDSVGLRGEGGSKELELWYKSDTLAQLRYIWKIIEQQPVSLQRQLLAIFSNVLFACASTNRSLTVTGKERRHHWGWVADNVRPKSLMTHNAIALFREKLFNICSQPICPTSTQGKIIKQDARQMGLENESIDLVVTSPPYIGVIDYTHAHRLLYLWMGWSMDEERRNEIGARFRRFRKYAVTEYINDMRLSRDEIYRVLKHGAYCAIVIGESKKFPGTANQIIEMFGEKLAIVWGPTTRYLTRRRVSDRQPGDPVEQICVFQKN